MVVLSQSEERLLASVREDGCPLMILGPLEDFDLQVAAIALLEKGLVEVYGGEALEAVPDDQVDAVIAELRKRAEEETNAPPHADVAVLSVRDARAVLEDPRNWSSDADRLWSLCTTAEGERFLRSQP
jgi:hypothetical protein